jgi:hypothetical protein
MVLDLLERMKVSKSLLYDYEICEASKSDTSVIMS